MRYLMILFFAGVYFSLWILCSLLLYRKVEWTKGDYVLCAALGMDWPLWITLLVILSPLIFVSLMLKCEDSDSDN